MTYNIIWKIVLVIYIFSFTWSSLPFFGFGEINPEPYGVSCSVEWVNPTESK